MKRKKGYIKTLEAFLAFFATFMFVVFVVLKGVPDLSEKATLDILRNLEQQDSFRDCVYGENVTCMDQFIGPMIPLTHKHKTVINLPDPPQTTKNIYTETILITGNTTNDYKVIYLYYWAI